MSHGLEVDQHSVEDLTPKNGEIQSPENILHTVKHDSELPLNDVNSDTEDIAVHDSDFTQPAFDKHVPQNEMHSDHSPITPRRSTSPSLNHENAADEGLSDSDGHSSPPTTDLQSFTPVGQQRSTVTERMDHPVNKLSSTISREQKKYLMTCLRTLKRHRDAGPFLQPVDPIKLGIPDYPKIVHRPMDLSTAEKKLSRNEYDSVDEYMNDIRLVFSNCVLYNGRDSSYSLMAGNVSKLFEKQMTRIPAEVTAPRTPAFGTGEQTPASGRRLSIDAHRPKRDVHPPSTHDFATPKNSAKKGSSNRKGDSRLKFCSALVKELSRKAYHACNAPFLQPVDPIALGIPDYLTIIRQPMDLGTIQKKLSGGQYMTAEQCEADIRLMLRNCYAYNAVNTPVYNMGKQLEHIFQTKWRELPPAESTSKATPVVQRVAPPSKSRPKSASRPKKSGVDDFTDEDSDVDQDIDSIQNQLQDMAAKLAALVAKKEKKKAMKKSSASARQPTTTPKNKASNTSKAMKPPRSGPAKPRTKKAPGEATQRKRARPEHMSGSVDAEEITFEQKQELSEKINCLTEEKLVVVAEMIRASMPHLTEENNEIELDIEALDRHTLVKLYRYVNANATPSLPTTMHDAKRQKVGDDLSGNDQFSPATKLPGETGYLSSSDSSGSDSGTDSDSDVSSSEEAFIPRPRRRNPNSNRIEDEPSLTTKPPSVLPSKGPMQSSTQSSVFTPKADVWKKGTELGGLGLTRKKEVKGEPQQNEKKVVDEDFNIENEHLWAELVAEEAGKSPKAVPVTTLNTSSRSQFQAEEREKEKKEKEKERLAQEERIMTAQLARDVAAREKERQLAEQQKRRREEEKRDAEERLRLRSEAKRRREKVESDALDLNFQARIMQAYSEHITRDPLFKEREKERVRLVRDLIIKSASNLQQRPDGASPGNDQGDPGSYSVSDALSPPALSPPAYSPPAYSPSSFSPTSVSEFGNLEQTAVRSLSLTPPLAGDSSGMFSPVDDDIALKS